MLNPLDFSKQTALITGGNHGIGKAMVDLFLQQGAKVIVLDLPKEPSDKKENLFYFSCNIADEEQCQKTLEQICEKFPDLSILVNNAGISEDTVLWKMSSEKWHNVLEVNLTGAFYTMRALTPHFRKRNEGTMINISSINGMRGKFGQANYAASKAGLIGLTKTAASELGRFNIRVNCVAPGMVHTSMTQRLKPEVLKKAQEESPLGKIADPQQIAQAVLFLCSPWARHITGTTLQVDGGQYL